MLELSRAGKIPGILIDGKLNYAVVFENIVGALCKYLTDCNLKCVVIGLSGGLDSTVASAIWKEVYVRTGVPLLGYSLPCSTNQADEQDGAVLAGTEFCNEFHVVNIEEWFKQSVKACTVEGTEQTHLADGNIKARLRMVFLYNVAGLRHGIVSDQDMNTERLLGFYTISGDQFDISPLAGLWKTEVYELANWLLENKYKDSKALKAAIAITPTDGNGVMSGGDMAQIAPGLTYTEVDEVLKMWVGLNEKIRMEWWSDHSKFNTEWALNRLCKKYGTELVDGIIRRHLNSEFKRKKHPMPVDPIKGYIDA